MHLPWKLLGRQWKINLQFIYGQELLLSPDILSKAQATPVSPLLRCDRKMKGSSENESKFHRHRSNILSDQCVYDTRRSLILALGVAVIIPDILLKQNP